MTYEKKQVVSESGRELVVNADGSLTNGTATADSGDGGYRKVQVVGENGSVLVVNADGSITAA